MLSSLKVSNCSMFFPSIRIGGGGLHFSPREGHCHGFRFVGVDFHVVFTRQCSRLVSSKPQLFVVQICSAHPPCATFIYIFNSGAGDMQVIDVKQKLDGPYECSLRDSSVISDHSDVILPRLYVVASHTGRRWPTLPGNLEVLGLKTCWGGWCNPRDRGPWRNLRKTHEQQIDVGSLIHSIQALFLASRGALMNLPFSSNLSWCTYVWAPPLFFALSMVAALNLVHISCCFQPFQRVPTGWSLACSETD